MSDETDGLAEADERDAGLVDSLADRREGGDDFVAPLGVDYGAAATFDVDGTTGLILGGVPPAEPEPGHAGVGVPMSREIDVSPSEAVADELEELGYGDETFDVLFVQTVPEEPVETDLFDHVDADRVVGPHPAGFDVDERPESDPLAESFPDRPVRRRMAIRKPGSMSDEELVESRRAYMYDSPNDSDLELFYLSPSQGFSEKSLPRRLPDTYRTPRGTKPPNMGGPGDATGVSPDETTRYTSLAMELRGEFGTVLVTGPGGYEVLESAMEVHDGLDVFGDRTAVDGVLASPRALDAPTKRVREQFETMRPSAVHMFGQSGGDLETELSSADRTLLNAFCDQLTTSGRTPLLPDEDGESESVVLDRSALSPEVSNLVHDHGPDGDDAGDDAEGRGKG